MSPCNEIGEKLFEKSRIPQKPKFQVDIFKAIRVIVPKTNPKFDN